MPLDSPAPLAAQRCSIYPSREAVARCPSCRQFFCRECITEHDGAMICVTCLDQIVAEEKKKKEASGLLLSRAWLALRFGAAFLLAWMLYLAWGSFLAKLPDDFHQGTPWAEVLKQNDV